MRRPTAEERAAIGAAVAAAEAGTSGEIVTIIADQSDAYHDAALHWAVFKMLLVPLLFALFPAAPVWLVERITGGWTKAALSEVLLLTFVVMAVVFLAVRYTLAYRPLRLLWTPRATKRRRVRARAVALFRVSAEARTTGRTGILIYLSLGERMAEIVADEAIHARVDDSEWGEAMAALVGHVREGRIGAGMVAAIERVGAVLQAHLPRLADDVNELPDRLIEL